MLRFFNKKQAASGVIIRN
ncbi:hypothetical protein Gotur_027441, partial [Gossypium turneri]